MINNHKLISDEKFGTPPIITKSRLVFRKTIGSHIKLVHPERADFIIFPHHGPKEIGKGLEKKIRKQAGL